ncbi:hypothetical protein [Paenibacillus kobensis]|uniref:hypothetical protein n=1 Tax=Paenibacillus kobensis TaxID=59841 RepID=UPI000FD9C866|nr:hypothetical protein [Paenibacillus kobensis]
MSVNLNKKLLIALLTCAIATGGTAVTAADSTNANEVQPTETKQPEAAAASAGKALKNADKLNTKEILKVALYHIKHYLKDDVQTQGKKLSASDDLLPLYDFEGNLFAYMVPLLEAKKEIGFITVGALTDGYDVYSVRIEDNAVSTIREQLAAALANGASEATVVFLPPYQYFVKAVQPSGEQYTDLTQPKAAKDVTQRVLKNKAALRSGYEFIRNAENEKHLSNILNTPDTDADTDTAANADTASDPVAAVSALGASSALSSSTVMAVAAATVTKEDIALSSERNYSQFVPVEYKTGVYSYGGDQGWYAKSSQQDNGCGPVAAANITNYMATVTNSTKYGKMYTGSTLSYSNFLAHMNTMYTKIDPGWLGELSIWDFADKVESYAKDKGVTLKRVTSSASFTLDNTANYIKAGLNSNVPVGTLNLSMFSDYEYEWHWMTITKYYRDVNDNRWIAVSTWGRRESINYQTHFDAMKAFEGIVGAPGLIYFS